VNPTFGIWGNNFFISYDVFRKLNISYYQKLKLIEVTADDAVLKIQEHQISFSTNGDSKTQSSFRLASGEYLQLKKSLDALIKDYKLRSISLCSKVFMDVYEVKQYSLFVKNTSEGFKVQNPYSNYK
jgi:hypothetical protein